MSVERGDAALEWEADKRDHVADARDAIADQRDATADARDVAATVRDELASSREGRLRIWEQDLEALARRLGLVREEPSPEAELAQDAAARDAAAKQRDEREGERLDAARARHAAGLRRSARRRDTLLAAAFAGVAEHLQESRTAEELLTQVAEAAVSMIVGSSRATVEINDAVSDPTDPPAGARALASGGPGASLIFPFQAPAGGSTETQTMSLTVFTTDPVALDSGAEDIGFILAAHASLAARALGERVRLERLSEQLERALMSRDVIGQAKGILMERLKITPDAAFDMLKRSSQLLNIKLREVARTITETGEAQPDKLALP